MHHHQGRKERYDKHILREKKVICIYTHKEATKVWITVMKKIYITANKLLLVHTNTHTLGGLRYSYTKKHVSVLYS